MSAPSLSKSPIEKSPERINNILLGPLERPALAWMAKKMPAWVTPDLLTGTGLLATVLIFISYLLTNIHPAFLWLASFGFILNWFGDSLDGSLARYRHIERPRYGFFIDHTIDAISEVLIFLGLGLSPFIDFRIATLFLISYLLLSILTYIATYVNGVFRISFLKLGPTEMRVIAILINAFLFFIPEVQTFTFKSEIFSLYDLIVFFLATVLFAAFLGFTYTTGRELSKQDIAHREAKLRKAKRKKHKLEQTSGQAVNVQ